MSKYEPELGQAVLGQPYQKYIVKPYIEAALAMLKEELNRIMWNITQKKYDSPFSNTGNEFKCDTFEVCAYSWDEDVEQPYNFKWKDVLISWYKYLGRSISVNREFTPDECSVMLIECLNALKSYEAQHARP